MRLSRFFRLTRQQAIDEATHRDGDGSKAIALALVYLADTINAKDGNQ